MGDAKRVCKIIEQRIGKLDLRWLVRKHLGPVERPQRIAAAHGLLVDDVLPVGRGDQEAEVVFGVPVAARTPPGDGRERLWA